MSTHQSAKQFNQDIMIPFIDLAQQKNRIRGEVLNAVERVIDHGAYVMGPEVIQLEKELAKMAGAKYALSCSSGTDALFLALLAKGIGKGQAVFVPAFTFVATAEVVAFFGATPVFVDVCPKSFNIDPISLCEAADRIKNTDLRATGVIPVDLFGQPADYNSIHEIANQFNLWVIADAAQSFGAKYHNRPTGQLAELTTTSFFPAKPLGCYGEGGAVFTDDDTLFEAMVSLRCHGQGESRYEHIRLGLNARLPTIQAAILLEKLRIFPEELKARQEVADRYSAGLADIAMAPELAEGCTSSWAQYTIRLKNRDQVIEKLKQKGIPAVVYYPMPINEQIAYRQYPVAPAGVNVCQQLSGDVMSLPMHAYLDETTQSYIIASLHEILKSSG